MVLKRWVARLCYKRLSLPVVPLHCCRAWSWKIRFWPFLLLLVNFPRPDQCASSVVGKGGFNFVHLALVHKNIWSSLITYSLLISSCFDFTILTISPLLVNFPLPDQFELSVAAKAALTLCISLGGMVVNFAGHPRIQLGIGSPCWSEG